MQSTVPFSARWFFRSNASAIHSENSVIDDLYVAADAEWGNGACIESFNRRYLAVFSLGPARLGLLALSPKPRRISLCAHVKGPHAGRTRSRGPFFIAHCPGIWVHSRASVN